MAEKKQEQTTNIEDAEVVVETKAIPEKVKLVNEPVEPIGAEIKKPGIEGITVEQEPERIEVKESKITKKDNLTEHTDGVQKRINELTRARREAERQREAAYSYAKGLQRELEDVKKNYVKYDEQYLKEFEARVEAESTSARSQLKAAIEAQDSEAIMKAQDKLTQLAVQKERARLTQAERAVQAAKPENQETNQQAAVQGNLPPEPSKKAKKWAENNEWFGSDKVLTSAAYAIHDDLVQQGFDTESDEYYNEVDKQMKDNFPHRFNQNQEQSSKKIVQTVAPAGKTNTGRRTVRLTKSQVAMAKKLNVPLEEYAKYVKEGA